MFLAKALAEAFVHEVAETILETSHSIACLAELAVHDGHNDKESHRGIDSRDNGRSSDVEILPMRVLCQLRLMPSSMLYILDEETEACEFRSASIGVDFDNDWEVTSHPVRYLLLATLYSMDLFTDEIVHRSFFDTLKNSMGDDTYYDSLFSAMNYLQDVNYTGR